MNSLKNLAFLVTASVLIAGCNSSSDSGNDGGGGAGGSGSSGGSTSLSAFSQPLFLIGNDGSSGNLSDGSQLWKTDGTESGTTKVKAIFPGDDAKMRDFTRVGDLLFFTAEDGSGNGRQLWVSDGSEAGTQRLTDISTHKFARMLTNVNGLLHFYAVDATTDLPAIWTTDGTVAGTKLVVSTELSSDGIKLLTAFDNKLFFAYHDSAGGGTELWRSDPMGDTALFANIHTDDKGAGSLYSCPDGFAELNGWLYFAADDGVGGSSCDLWRTDGALGAEKVSDISDSLNNGPRRLVVTDHTLYFLTPGSQAAESAIWVSDGSAQGTQRVFESNEDYRVLTGSVTEKTGHLMGAGGYAYFYVNDLNSSNGLQLWYTDGTDANMLVDLQSNALADYRIPKAVSDDRLFYIAFRPDNLTRGLWTAQGTQTKLLPTGSGLGSGTPMLTTEDSKTLVFRSDLEVWRTDGSDQGTGSVKKICPGPCDGFLGPKPND